MLALLPLFTRLRLLGRFTLQVYQIKGTLQTVSSYSRCSEILTLRGFTSKGYHTRLFYGENKNLKHSKLKISQSALALGPSTILDI